MLSLKTPVASLPTVSSRLLKKLQRLKLETVADLIFHHPWRYDDFSKIYPIRDLLPGARATIRGRVEQIVSRRSKWRRQLLVEAVVSDATGQLRVVWFNQAFLVKAIKVGEELYLAGTPEMDRYGLALISPVYEKARADSSSVHTGRLVPIYPTTSGLTNKQLRFLISRALVALPRVSEWLPKSILDKYGLLGLRDTLKHIHFPGSAALLERAKERLKFEELFLMQVKALASARDLRQAAAPALDFKEAEIKKFVAGLPFKLTDDQRLAAWEILQDLRKSNPMNRLLEGDVGSGKTAVAAIAIYNTALNDYQSALLAPTEILARQHAETLSKLFSSRGIKVALLTASNQRLIKETGDLAVSSKKELAQLIRSGQIDVIVGTHALLQGQVQFKDLALCVVDEQHRFGVEQRHLLKEKGAGSYSPHFLSLTATPIPRSLALTLYGDLDLSIIRQLPSGRRPIVTKLVDQANRHKAYDFIRGQAAAGRQVFVICPLIEKPEPGQLRRLVFDDRKAVAEEFLKLKKDVWPDLSIGMLHGKMQPKEKEQVMKEFASGKQQVLVSTSVVEVGIDVPNATVMMIEGAEGFGLAQLHQFRGRVGRGPHQSYCLLFSYNLSAEAKERLEAFVKTTDGFELAERDLALRGPGEVCGTLQSGFPDLKFASLNDLNLIKKAREAAGLLLDIDPDLAKFAMLSAKLEKWGRETHLE